MFRTVVVATTVAVAVAAPSATPRLEGTKTVTRTGWFSDGRCARVTDGDVRPNNPECVRRCLNEGAKAVFLSEQEKAIFEVRDYPTVKDDVGYRLEVTGVVDDSTRTISVKSVTRLSKVTAMCLLPKRGK
jgi:hypothetical protein